MNRIAENIISKAEKVYKKWNDRKAFYLAMIELGDALKEKPLLTPKLSKVKILGCWESKKPTTNGDTQHIYITLKQPRKGEKLITITTRVLTKSPNGYQFDYISRSFGGYYVIGRSTTFSQSTLQGIVYALSANKLI